MLAISCPRGGWLRASGSATGENWLTGDVLVHAPDLGSGPGYANANVFFTAPVSGTADIFVELWNARNLGRSQSAQLFVNNVLSASFILPGSITRASPLTASLSVLLAAGDTVMLSIYRTFYPAYGDFVGTDFTVNLTPSAVPLPAALPLFATGLGVLGFAGWRRKRKAAALAAA